MNKKTKLWIGTISLTILLCIFIPILFLDIITAVDLADKVGAAQNHKLTYLLAYLGAINFFINFMIVILLSNRWMDIVLKLGKQYQG